MTPSEGGPAEREDAGREAQCSGGAGVPSPLVVADLMEHIGEEMSVPHSSRIDSPVSILCILLKSSECPPAAEIARPTYILVYRAMAKL